MAFKKISNEVWVNLTVGLGSAAIAVLLTLAIADACKQETPDNSEALRKELQTEQSKVAKIGNERDAALRSKDTLVLRNQAQADSIIALNDVIARQADSLVVVDKKLKDCEQGKRCPRKQAAQPAPQPKAKQPVQKQKVAQPAPKQQPAKPAQQVQPAQPAPQPQVVHPAPVAVPANGGNTVILQENAQNNGVIVVGNNNVVTQVVNAAAGQVAVNPADTVSIVHTATATRVWYTKVRCR